mgnify:CR=1 FL=1
METVSSVGLSASRWASAPPRFGSGCFHIGQRKSIIRTHLLSEKGSDYMGLVPVVGLEPTRYRYQRILSPSRLPIPSHRQIPIHYTSSPRKIQEELSKNSKNPIAPSPAKHRKIVRILLPSLVEPRRRTDPDVRPPFSRKKCPPEPHAPPASPDPARGPSRPSAGPFTGTIFRFSIL